MTLRCADQYSNQWATPATPVNTFVLIHLPKTRWAAPLTFIHHPGSAKETPIQPAFQMSLHFKNCQQLFVSGFCFYCRRVFIKILFAGPCHLNKICHRNALTIIVSCISKLYYILCVPTKWRYRENTNQVGEPLMLLLNTHMSPLSKLGVTRCLPSKWERTILERLKQDGFFLTKGLIPAWGFQNDDTLMPAFLIAQNILLSQYQYLLFSLTLFSD